ncbi:hypothetical protein BH10BAC5_BH10BAC5_29360 [soil metagenome]
MGLKVEDDEASGKIKLSWLHNMEPDMGRGHGELKKYNIYKAVGYGDTVPTNYFLLASVELDSNYAAEFIDTTTKATCCIPDIGCPSPPCIEIYHVRYQITAVDVTEWESVRSDFQGTLGWRFRPGSELGGHDEELFPVNSNIPKQFKLEQNYPNPFNPTTNIVYDLPKDGIVTIKIFDVLGREIKILVNEFKHAGSYLIQFEGSQFASGVYFYRIVSNSFIQTKRMILMK